MKRHGYITAEEEEIANSVHVKDLLVKRENSKNPYQAFLDTVVAEVMKKTDKQNPYNIPMQIYTTLDTDRQDYLNKVINGELFTWPNDVVQTGVAVTDTKTGAILALCGGRNINIERAFNRATSSEMKKQPGSTAKPLFDYGPGIEYNNWSTYTPFIDDAYSYTNGPSIQDWDSKYMGLLTLKQSLGLSRNIPALKAFQQVNNKDIVNFVTSLGIKPEIDNGRVHEAHSLGAFTGVNPLQMAAAYAAFGNGGYYIEPYTVSKITFTDTNETKEYNPVKNKVMSDSTAYLISNVLTWATDYGLSDDARVNGYQIAAKTGTTNFDGDTIRNYGLPADALNDLWAIGYNPDVSVGLWYGYDTIDKKFVSRLADVTRKKRLFNTIMKGMVKGTTKAFKVPNSVIAVEVEKNTIPAMLPSDNTPQGMRITEYFKKGAEPTDISPRYQQLPNVTGLKVEKTGGKLQISWSDITTPAYYTDASMREYFNTYYGKQSDKYYQLQKQTNSTEIGTLGYDIYYKSGDEELHPLGSTTNTSLTVNKPDESGNLTIVVKTAFSIFKASASKGSEFTFTNEPVSTPDVNVGNDIKISKGNTLPTEPSFDDVTVTDGGIPVDESKITPVSIIITDNTNNTVNYSSIDTNTVATYTITYTVKYNEDTLTGKKSLIIQ
jgi:penicillin-binding protein 1A